LFTTTITVFNFEESTDKFYPTLFTGTEIQPDFKTEFTNRTTDDMDMSLLIIKYYISESKIYSYGNTKVYKTPKLWDNLSGTVRANYFTFKPGRDFFVIGNYSTTTNADYEVFKSQNDDVFFINDVKVFRDDLKHWEILGY